MSETNHHTIANHDAANDERRETALATPEPSPQPLTPSDIAIATQDHQHDEPQPLSEPSAGTCDSGEKRTAKSEEQTANGEKRSAPVKLCRHTRENGVYCQVPALRGRQYCYNHLRLRGQQMRIARALAQRQTFHLLLPPLEDMNAVQSALIHVTAALAAGLLERRHAGQLLYSLQLTINNLRNLERAQKQAQAAVAPAAGQSASAPLLSPSVGDNVGPGQQMPRVVEDYPGFEAEFGLPPGLDLTLPPHVAFPPPAKTNDPWAGSTPPEPRPMIQWTKEDIELEELDNQRSSMSEQTYNKKVGKITGKIYDKTIAGIRQQREAEWEAEAARRNAREGEKARRWRSMDAAQQRAYWEGVGDAHETAERDRREEARKKKPAATARDETTVEIGKLPETEGTM